MSMVGPRPERPEFAAMFQEDVYRYRERHRVKSGITVRPRFTASAAEATASARHAWPTGSSGQLLHRELVFWLDIKILLMTLAATIHFRQAKWNDPERAERRHRLRRPHDPA